MYISEARVQQFSQVLAELYAAQPPENAVGLLKKLRNMVVFDNAAIFQVAQPGSLVVPTFLDLAPEWFALYKEYYESLDLYLIRSLRDANKGPSDRLSDYVSLWDWQANEHCMDFLKPQSIRYIACADGIIHGQLQVILSLHRSSNDFSDEDLFLLSQLSPHLPLLMGMIHKTGDSRAISERWAGLTPRECQVALLVKEGLVNRDIALSLGISEGTVKVLLRSVFKKTGVRTRTELAYRLA